MTPGHRFLAAAAVVAVILISVLAAPSVARITLADAQAAAGDTTAFTLQDDADETPTATTTPGETDDTVGVTPTGTASSTGTSSSGAVPGTIQAEDYDTGEQGVAWFDRTPGNQGGAYREDDVDIETGGSGYVVAYVKSSEWLTYTVDVAEAVTYNATFRASSPWDDRQVWVWVDGVLEAQVRVPNTGSFDVYEDATADITLPGGSHTVRLQFYRDSQNLDYMTFESEGEPTGTPTPEPTGTVTPTPTATGTMTPAPTVTVTPTVTGGQGGAGNETPGPTPTGNVTITPTVTPTGNVTVTPTPTSGQGSGGQGGGANVSDLTNQNSPEAATFLGNNQSATALRPPAVPIGLERVIGNLTSPLFVTTAGDGSDRHFVVDQNGYVQVFYLNGTVVEEPFLDVRDRMVNLSPVYDERGLLSIAFHPDFSTNGRVYAYYSAPLRAEAPAGWSCTNRLSEFTVGAGSDTVDTNTERILMEIDKPQANHNGGILLFGPNDGYLYLTLGDGGGANDTGMGHTPGIGNAQDLTKIYGKVLRIDVDTTTGPTWNATANATWTSGAGTFYGIPADNPFVVNASVPPEVYAYGFRNPAFATFDAGGSNRMFVAMAGQRLFEAVHVVYGGGAYPWNIREGTHCFDPSDNTRVPNDTCRITGYVGDPLIGPVVELGHDVGNTIVGGAVYRGSNLSDLQGAYLFGTWSDESRAVGNGTLLIARPPTEFTPATLPENAANLTADQNAMWTTSEMTVANNANGRLNAFLRGVYEDADREALVLINQNGGPGITPLNSGEVWRVVDANTPGLVPIGNATGEAPQVEIVAPAEGATVAGPSVTVYVNVTNFQLVDALGAPNVPGQGHLHYFIDVEPPTTPGQPAVTEPGTYVPTANTTHTWANVTPGMHTFSVELTNNNHTPLQPPVTRTVTVNVSEGAAGTPTPGATPPAEPTGTTTPALNSTVDLAAQNLEFSQSEITVQAGALVTVNFNNMDAGIPHNFAVYSDSSAAATIFQGQVVTGPTTTTYTFTAPSAPGSYFFRCDVHPETMTGTFTVT